MRSTAAGEISRWQAVALDLPDAGLTRRRGMDWRWPRRGLAGTAFFASGLRGLFYGIGPQDPSTLIGVVLLVAGTGLLSASLPARHAARVEPSKLLRMD